MIRGEELRDMINCEVMMMNTSSKRLFYLAVLRYMGDHPSFCESDPALNCRLIASSIESALRRDYKHYTYNNDTSS